MSSMQNIRNKNSDYRPFQEAAKKRSDAMRWDNLFATGSDDIILELGQVHSSHGHKSLDDRICKLYTAVKQEINTRLNRNNPIATPKLSDDKKQLLDAANPGKILTNVGTFLREQDWALFDDWNRAISTGDKDAKPVTRTRSLSLSDIAHINPVAADEIDPADLRVIISRDPHKIAEMSTAQRWSSCMAEGHINYSYVAHDVEQGSLVAYLVHKDDKDAHYPLMRQLLKPYHNHEGRTILVPAVIYGGNGIENATSRELFKTTTVDFVKSRVNGNAFGAYKMDGAIYPDGEATEITLGKTMDAQVLASSMADYIKGALQELRTELFAAKDREHTAKDDTAKKIAQKQQEKLTKKLTQLVTPDGLANQYFRTLRSSSLSENLPSPAMMVAAAKSKEVIAQQTLYAPLVYISLLNSEKLTHALHAITTLDLPRNLIQSYEIAVLTKALAANTTLISLDVEYNNIGDEGAKALAANTTLTSLNAMGNNIGDEGAKALATNTTLTSLNVGGNNIGAEGAKALAANTTLTSLDMAYNNIGAEGAKALAANTTLTSLNVRGNNIGAEGAKALEEGLRHNLNLLTSAGVNGLAAHCNSNREKATAWVARLDSASSVSLSDADKTDLARRRNAVMAIASEQGKEKEMRAILNQTFPPGNVINSDKHAVKISTAPPLLTFP